MSLRFLAYADEKVVRRSEIRYERDIRRFTRLTDQHEVDAMRSCEITKELCDNTMTGNTMLRDYRVWLCDQPGLPHVALRSACDYRVWLCDQPGLPRVALRSASMGDFEGLLSYATLMIPTTV